MAYFQANDGRVYQTNGKQWFPDCKALTNKEGATLYKEQVKSELLAWIKPGQTVYTNVNHVSRSGMLRNISVYIVKDGRIHCINGHVSIVTGRTTAKDGSIKCNGCGMDMGWDLVYSLGRAVWPDGTPEPHGKRNGEPDSDGGYALKHSAL